MMTTALKELYAFLDAWQVDDNGKVDRPLPPGQPGRADHGRGVAGPDPDRADARPDEPELHALVRPRRRRRRGHAGAGLPGRIRSSYPPSAVDAALPALRRRSTADKDVRRSHVPAVRRARRRRRSSRASDFTRLDDGDDPPAERRARPTTAFYDLAVAPRRRPSSCSTIPRVGFFSTPAFFANWQTNISNQMRVTTHQALIVATGSSIDGTDTTTPPGTPGLDAAHATQAACFGCHKMLDPTRSIFSAT